MIHVLIPLADGQYVSACSCNSYREADSVINALRQDGFKPITFDMDVFLADPIDTVRWMSPEGINWALEQCSRAIAAIESHRANMSRSTK